MKDPGRYVTEVLRPETRTVSVSSNILFGNWCAVTLLLLSQTKTELSYRVRDVSILEIPIPINSETCAFNPVPFVPVSSKSV